MQNVNYQKTKNAIKYWLLGKAEENSNYYDVVKAMNFAEKIHSGLRKDGKTPIFQYQISIALYLKTIHKNFINPVEVLVLAFLHDVYEDHPEAIEKLKEQFPQYFEKVKTLSKVEYEFNKDGSVVFNENGKAIKHLIEYETYFNKISQCPSCSLVKGVDRVHNLATMIGVFSSEKQKSYAEEVYQYFLPMLKKARKNFVEQENAYENLKSFLTVQVETVLNLKS